MDIKALVTEDFEGTEIYERSLSSSLGLLSFYEFLTATNRSADEYVVSKFLYPISDGIPIYIDNELIKWCGYEKISYKQRRHFLKQIRLRSIEFIELGDDQYTEFKNSYVSWPNYYPEIDRSNGKNRTKHNLITPDNFHLLFMRMPTPAIHIRRFIHLINLVKLYWQYQAGKSAM